MFAYAERFYDWQKIDKSKHAETRWHLEKTLFAFLQLEYSSWVQHLAQRVVSGAIMYGNRERYILSKENVALKDKIKMQEASIEALNAQLANLKQISMANTFTIGLRKQSANNLAANRAEESKELWVNGIKKPQYQNHLRRLNR